MVMHKGKSVVLRPFEKEDSEIYRRWINDPNTGLLVDRVLPVTQAEHEKWYTDLTSNENAVVFGIETVQKPMYIGNVWLWNIDWRHRKAELRILIGEKNYLGKGYGSEAIEMMTQLAFKNLNLHKVYAYVLESNPRARKAFEKAGFIIEGVLRKDRFVDGKYEDVRLVAKIGE